MGRLTVASPKRRRWALRFMNKMHHLNGGDGSHLQWSNIPVGESQRQCRYEQINTHKDAHACTPLTPCRGRLPKFHRPLCSSLGQASSSPQKKVVKAWHKAITSYQICISPPLLSNESSRFKLKRLQSQTTKQFSVGTISWTGTTCKYF